MFNDFVAQLKRENKSDLTLRQYNSSWSRFKAWWESSEGVHRGEGGSFSPQHATQIDIQNFKRWASNKFKPNTVRQTLTQLRAYFSHLITQGVIPDNPVEHIDAVHTVRATPKWLSRIEQNALIRAVRGHGNLRELTIITMLIHTGLRVQELCDLQINDIEIGERKGKVIVRCGKHNKYREVPLNVDVRRILSQYLTEHKPQSYLFPSQRSEKSTSRAIQHSFKKFADLTGIKDLTPHTLRHTFCHELVGRKVPLDVVARLAGHIKNDGSPNIQQTLVYTQPGEADLQRAVEELSWV